MTVGALLFFGKWRAEPVSFSSDWLLSSASLCRVRIFSWNSSKLRFESFSAACSSLSDDCLSCGEAGSDSNTFKVSASLARVDGMISKGNKGVGLGERRENIHVNEHQERYHILHRHKESSGSVELNIQTSIITARILISTHLSWL